MSGEFINQRIGDKIRVRVVGDDHVMFISSQAIGRDYSAILPKDQALALARWIIENVNDGEKDEIS